MNAETLSGTVLGTCTLQKLIGRGGMGAVFLAQQSRPKRQVAVKVLLPLTTLQPHQHAAFLERFRRETDAAASLEHPNIMPVHEYGERKGLTYLVMSYVSGGTLRDELEQEKQLPFTKIVNYLEQIAAALDFAHERGVIHRDVKPANILMTPDKRLLLTDFGLVKIITEGQAPQNPLSEAGMPIGTPDYMAPEQVIGREIDNRADLYALGVILYQMVTGSVPFKAEMPMKVALQHLDTLPPSPRTLRSDLPVATEQVILRALAKRPADRYKRAQDLASAFRLTLESTSTQVRDMNNKSSDTPSNNDNSTISRRRSLFDPIWRENAPATNQDDEMPTDKLETLPPALLRQQNNNTARNDIVGKTSVTLPSFSGIMDQTNFPTPTSSLLTKSPNAFPPPNQQPSVEITENETNSSTATTNRLRLGHKTSLRGLQAGQSTTSSLLPPEKPALPPFPMSSSFNNPPMSGVTNQLNNTVSPFVPGLPDGSTRKLEPFTPTGGATRQLEPYIAEPAGNTGTLQLPTGEYSGETGMLKLAQPVKVVKVPIAGQPGQYMTGILPILPPTPTPEALPFKKQVTNGLKKNMKLVILIATVLLVIFGSIAFMVARTPAQKQTRTNHTVATTPNLGATATVQATATAEAKVILNDPLEENIAYWPLKSGAQTFVFKDHAYHVSTSDSKMATALLPNDQLTDSFTYKVTMNEVKGDDNNEHNRFGLLLHYNERQDNGNTVANFYSFRVQHTNKGGVYLFSKFDNTNNGNKSPWNDIWKQSFGDEYHLGQGSANNNTVTVVANGADYTLIVNGKQLNTVHDDSYKGGKIGMAVNLSGTEVAFTNLLLTRN